MSDETQGHSFRITIRHVWEEQQEMRKLLQRVSDHLPTVAKKLEEHERETYEILKDHETRLRKLEVNVYRAGGAIAIVAGAAPFLARLLP